MSLQKSLLIVLPNLRDIREHPPSLHVSVGSEIDNSVNTQSSYNELDLLRADVDVAADNMIGLNRISNARQELVFRI